MVAGWKLEVNIFIFMNMNSDFLRDLLAALIWIYLDLTVLPGCPPFPSVMLPRYLKWLWISTRLGPAWIQGGAAVVTAVAG